MILAVDYAPSSAAAVLCGLDGAVVLEFDSHDQTNFEFAGRIRDEAWAYRALVVVEDVPHGMRFTRACRMQMHAQGRLLCMFESAGMLEKLIWVPPSLWQRELGVFKQGKDAVSALYSGEYKPEFELPERERGSGPARQKARKIITDYYDAYAIYKWAMLHLDELLEGELPNGAVRYGQ